MVPGLGPDLLVLCYQSVLTYSFVRFVIPSCAGVGERENSFIRWYVHYVA
jgi:hypothetical protein